MAERKELLLVAGANGAGKTTFAAREYLASRELVYLSADAIAEELSPGDPTSAKLKAGRQFLRELDSALTRPDNLVVESTLSGLGVQRLLRNAADNGFVTTITYLYLDSPETCIARVQERVRKRGHDVPAQDIRRRFWRSLRNFWSIYRHLADNWVVVYNAVGQFQDVAAGGHDRLIVRDGQLFSQFVDLVRKSEDV